MSYYSISKHSFANMGSKGEANPGAIALHKCTRSVTASVNTSLLKMRNNEVMYSFHRTGTSGMGAVMGVARNRCGRCDKSGKFHLNLSSQSAGQITLHTFSK